LIKAQKSNYEIILGLLCGMRYGGISVKFMSNVLIVDRSSLEMPCYYRNSNVIHTYKKKTKTVSTKSSFVTLLLVLQRLTYDKKKECLTPLDTQR
jgi:hypothetical protein